jgi:hypothetical protein
MVVLRSGCCGSVQSHRQVSAYCLAALLREKAKQKEHVTKKFSKKLQVDQAIWQPLRKEKRVPPGRAFSHFLISTR